MMGRGTAQNMQSFLTKINLGKLVHMFLLKRNPLYHVLLNSWATYAFEEKLCSMEIVLFVPYLRSL